ENVVTRTTDKGISVELLKDVKFDSVNVGENRFDQNGLYIFNGPSFTTAGINAGGKRVTNVADGIESTDAVNKGQLNAVDTKLDTAKTDLNNKIDSTEKGLTSKIDTTKSELTAQIDTTKTDLNNNINSAKTELNTKINTTETNLKNAGLNFVGNAGDVAHRNLGETLEIVGGADATQASSNENVVTRTTDKGISVELLKDVKFDSVNVGENTTLNNDGLIIKNGPSITTAGINAGGKRVTN
ncbi:TPA: hypothetical protein OV554_003745, partial [Acinetobacter baumannii]|nr:hypothetical protein [Acinetobacter baumannii]